jgi:hypothetical protein
MNHKARILFVAAVMASAVISITAIVLVINLLQFIWGLI